MVYDVSTFVAYGINVGVWILAALRQVDSPWLVNIHMLYRHPETQTWSTLLIITKCFSKTFFFNQLSLKKTKQNILVRNTKCYQEIIEERERKEDIEEGRREMRREKEEEERRHAITWLCPGEAACGGVVP